MKHRCCYLLAIVVCVSANLAQSQGTVDTSEVSYSTEWEKILETVSGDEEMSSLSDDLTFLKDNPVDLNKASQEELQRIPALTAIDAFRIVSRRTVEPFTRLEDLQMIEGITPELFSFIRPFVRMGKPTKSIPVRVSSLSRVSTEIEERKGFSAGIYPGSKAKVLNRFRLTLGRKESQLSSVISEVEIGAVAEKDPGERSLDSFTAAYALISLPVLSLQVLLGDFQVEAGEGLVFWRGTSFSKGSNVISPARKNGGGLHPYVSADENSYLRGLASSLDLGGVKLQLWYSHKSMNANLDSSGQIASVDQSGLFRTGGEIAKRNTAQETMIGFRCSALSLGGWKIGGTGYRSYFSRPLITSRSGSQSVSELSIEGVDLSYTNRNLDVFSEIAVDQKLSSAVIGGIIYQPLPILALTCVGRKYPQSFLGNHGNAFGETGGPVQNEEGIYLGLRIQPWNWLLWSSYYDQFRSPAVTDDCPIPTQGNDFLTLVEYKNGERYELGLRYKRKETSSQFAQNDVYGRITQPTAQRIQQNYRLTSEFSSSSSFRTCNRIEVVVLTFSGKPVSEQGFLVSQSVQWNLLPSVVLKSRLSMFETDSYDSRIYEFEEDLPGNYSNPALFGHGMRWYFILKYHLLSHVIISGKFSQTIKDGITSIGTGFDEIAGNIQSNLILQLNIQF